MVASRDSRAVVASKGPQAPNRWWLPLIATVDNISMCFTSWYLHCYPHISVKLLFAAIPYMETTTSVSVFHILDYGSCWLYLISISGHYPCGETSPNPWSLGDPVLIEIICFLLFEGFLTGDWSCGSLKDSNWWKRMMIDDNVSVMCHAPIYRGGWQIFYGLYNSEPLQSQLTNCDRPLGVSKFLWGSHFEGYLHDYPW